MEFGLTAILVPSYLSNRASQSTNVDALSCIDKDVTLCFAQHKEGGMWQTCEGNEIPCILLSHDQLVNTRLNWF